MKSLTGSALKLCLVKYNDKHKHIHTRSCFWCTTPKDAFLGCAYKHFKLSFSISVASRPQLIRPVFSTPALSSSDTQTQLHDEDAEVPDENVSKTVQVRFQLQRECLFGQHFFIVGDGPIFGLWDPSQAIPMNWSEGHVWTVELDVPIGKLIKYKFILKGGKNTILWQPGEDRELLTWETMKTITVVDDWNKSEAQKVIEGEPSAEPSKESVLDSEWLMVAENLAQSSGNLKEEVNEELSNASSLENLMPTVSRETAEQKGEVEVPAAETKQNKLRGINTPESNGRRAPNGESLLALENKTDLVCNEEFPVLVPGLTPILTQQNEEPSAAAVEKNEELNVSELKLKEEPAIETSDPQDTAELMINGQQELHEYQQTLEQPLLAEHEDRLEKAILDEREERFEMPILAGEERVATQPPEDNNVVEGDINWGRRTLQKFLMSFGLL